MGDLLGKRVIPLYRVSTKQQMGIEDDMPTQRNIVQTFILENKMIQITEFVEGGISGYKNKVNDRDALMSIKEMAKNKEFDILVIYHSNRFGRLQELAYLIKELYLFGVRLISVLEGELKAKTPTDMLMNSVRFFNNEQESYLKSEVISDYHIAAVEQGRFRGGNMIPYGYKLVDNGSKNYKGKYILDFVIDEEESKVIKEIFNLSLESNYGQSRIAKYLNNHKIKTKRGGVWYSSTIQYLMNNPIYKGQYHMNSKVRNKTVVSPILEELIIIPEEKWELNKLKMNDRKYIKDIHDVNDKRTSKNTFGKMLLNGIAFCGYCGLGLTTMTSYKSWTTKDGVRHKVSYYKYRCSSFYRHGGVKCEGKSTHSINGIEPAVVESAKAYAVSLYGRNIQEDFIKSLDKLIKDLEKEKVASRIELDKNSKKLNALGDELTKILIGESDMSKDMVSSLINKSEQLTVQLNKRMAVIDQEIINNKIEKEKYVSIGTQFIDWSDRYDKANLEERRSMLSNIISRVDVFSDTIEIKHSVRLETFKKNSYIDEKTSCLSTQSTLANCLYKQPINVFNETVVIQKNKTAMSDRLVSC